MQYRRKSRVQFKSKRVEKLGDEQLWVQACLFLGSPLVIRDRVILILGSSHDNAGWKAAGGRI